MPGTAVSPAAPTISRISVSPARAPAFREAVTVTSSGVSSETRSGCTVSVTTRDAVSLSDSVRMAGSTVSPLTCPVTETDSAPSAIASSSGLSMNVVRPVVSFASTVMSRAATFA